MRSILTKGTKTLVISGVAGGFIILVAALYVDPNRAWANILLNNYYFLSLALAGIIWVAIQSVSNSGWAVVLRRIPEAMATYLPVAALSMLSLYFGMDSLYKWTDKDLVAHSPLLQWKAPYLNSPFFIIRMSIFLGIWIIFSRVIVGNSLRQDKSFDIRLTRSNVWISALFLVLFALTFIPATFDWIMSLEPEWYSSLFPIYQFSGLFLNGIAAITIAAILLKRAGFLRVITEYHLRDLGKLMFAFSIFWAYIWFSQFMLIWYANISEEAAYYVVRTNEHWAFYFFLNPVLNWLIPFIVLLPKNAKKHENTLLRVSVVLLAGRWLDLYMMIMPAFQGIPRFGIYELTVFAGYASLFVLIMLSWLSKKPPIPINDPYLEESIHLHA